MKADIDGTAESVVLITFDTLRADVLSDYGGQRTVMPFLEDIAKKSTVFRKAYANGPKTPAAMPAIFTGELPFSQGYGYVEDSFVEELSERGYETYGFQRNALLNPSRGFEQGFDVFDYRTAFFSNFCSFISDLGLSKLPDLIFQKYSRWKYRREPREILSFAEEFPVGKDNSFTWIHVVSSHSPYIPSEEFREGYTDYSPDQVNDAMRSGVKSEELKSEARRMYEARLNELDQTFLKEFFNRISLDDTAVIVTSDHGEEFLEHGEWFHAMPEPRLYDELLRIPLMVYGPGGERKVVEEEIQQVDIPFLVFELLGEEVPSRFRNDREDIVSQVAEGVGGESNMDDPSIGISVIRDGYKYIYTDGDEELYDLEKDPDEKEDLSGEKKEMLEKFRDEIPEDYEVPRPDSAIKKDLEFLGYLDES